MARQFRETRRRLFSRVARNASTCVMVGGLGTGERGRVCAGERMGEVTDGSTGGLVPFRYSECDYS